MRKRWWREGGGWRDERNNKTTINSLGEGEGGGKEGGSVEGGRERNNKTIINTLGERSEKEVVEGRWREGGGTIRQ